MAIAIVYGVGTLVGGAIGPLLFGALIATKSPLSIFYGYAVGAGAMIVGAAIEWWLGIEAAGLKLEDVAAPLSVIATFPPAQGPRPEMA